MKNWRQFLVIVLLILLPTLFYSLCPYINYLAVSDPQHPLLFSPQTEIQNCWYHWQEHNFGGGYGLINSGRIIEAATFYALRTVFPPKFSFFLFTFLLLVMAGWGFYLFLREFVFAEKQNRHLLSIIGASFYATNLFVCITLAININLLFSYFLTPWVILYSLRYLHHPQFKNLLPPALLLSLCGVCPQVPTIVIMIIILVWTVVTFSIIAKYPARRVLFSIAKISAASLVLSGWWIIPTLIYSINFNPDIAGNLAAERFLSHTSSFLNVFHLSGYWEIFQFFPGRKVFYFVSALWEFRWGFIILAILLIAPFVYPRQSGRKDKILLPSLFGLLVVGYLLAQGYHDSSPIRALYLWLMDHSLLWGTFRNNYKFVALIAFVYSISLPYLYLLLRQLTHRREIQPLWLTSPPSKRIGFPKGAKMKLPPLVPIGIVLIILATYSFPLWTRTVYNHYYQGIPPQTYEVADFVNERMERAPGKMMILPGTWLPTYKWAFYHPVPAIFFSLIDNREAIVHRYGAEWPLSWNSKELVDNFLYEQLLTLNNQTLLNLGIKYLLLDKTLDPTMGLSTLPSGDIESLEDYLNRRFTKIYHNDKYRLYKIKGIVGDKMWVPSEVMTQSAPLTTGEVVNLMDFLNAKQIVMTEIPLREASEKERQPVLAVSLDETAECEFRYASWQKADEGDHLYIEEHKNGGTHLCAFLPQRDSLSIVGKISDKPLDLTKYDKMLLVVHTSSPQGDIALHILLGKGGQDDGNLASVGRIFKLSWSGWKTLEIHIECSALLEAGVDPEMIDWIQIEFENDRDAPCSLEVTLPQRIVLTSDKLIPAKALSMSELPPPAIITGWSKIEPTRYKVEINAAQPFMLAAAFAYDPLWVAKVNGKEYQSIPLYSVLTGFWVEDTGDLEITLEYKPQKWFYSGVGLSGASLTGALAYLIWGWRRRRLAEPPINLS